MVNGKADVNITANQLECVVGRLNL